MQNEGEVGCMSVWGGRCDGVGASGGDGGEIEGGGGGGGVCWGLRSFWLDTAWFYLKKISRVWTNMCIHIHKYNSITHPLTGSPICSPTH